MGVVGIAALLGLDLDGRAAAAGVAVALVLGRLRDRAAGGQPALPEVPGVAASAIALSVTAVVYAPFAIPRLGEVADASGKALLSLAALGVVCTARPWRCSSR